MMALFVLSLIVIAIAMLAMAVGVVLGGRCLRGSCGGPEVVDRDGEPVRCVSCTSCGKARLADSGADPPTPR
jgi:hypothetical protein